MTPAATVAAHGRLRIFCGLTLPADVRDAIGEWQRDSLRGDARLVEHRNLHVTLAFLGHRPAEDVGRVAEALDASARALAGPIVFSALR